MNHTSRDAPLVSLPAMVHCMPESRAPAGHADHGVPVKLTAETEILRCLNRSLDYLPL